MSNATVAKEYRSARTVSPSIVRSESSISFSMDQELTKFGAWSSDPIWVPPKDVSKELAFSMLEEHGLFASKDRSWQDLIDQNRSRFTQVREINLCKASIRLPKGKLFVTVTERKDFDKITDTVPACVRTRLDEFLEGPGQRRDVKVYYLKPLCVELDHKLIFTTREELDAAIRTVQDEVFTEYRKNYLTRRPGKAIVDAVDWGVSLPGRIVRHSMDKRKKAIEAYHAHLEFNRRKAAMRAVRLRKKYRTDKCDFDEVLSITNTPERSDVIEQYALQFELSQAEKRRLALACAETIPWFLAFSVGGYLATTTALSFLSISLVPPIMVCDPAFVAEMPGSNGELLKIGHFDEVNGITHVEI
jgi:hypothetical protein